MININIKNINIHSFQMENGRYPYQEFGNQIGKESTSVIAAIPRHDESKIFQKLFKVPNRYYKDQIN